MKFKLFSLLLVCLSMVFASGCSNDSAKKKKPAKKATSGKQMLPAADYWAKTKDNLGLTDKQIAGIKAINAKYAKKAQALKKAKKWDGKANEKNRKAVATGRSTELKKLLGNKVGLFTKFNSKNGIKPAAKPKKKAAPKKKPVKSGKKAPSKKNVKKKK